MPRPRLAKGTQGLGRGEHGTAKAQSVLHGPALDGQELWPHRTEVETAPAAFHQGLQRLSPEDSVSLVA